MRFCGVIGFANTVDNHNGVWTEEIVERRYTGLVLRNTRRWESSGSVNDNVNISNSISIIADSYAYENAYSIRYVEWMGSKWKVTDIDIERPRLVLSIGGVYND